MFLIKKLTQFHLFQLSENAQLIVAELKDHVIIQDGNHQNVISLANSNMSTEEIDQLVADGQVCEHFSLLVKDLINNHR